MSEFQLDPKRPLESSPNYSEPTAPRSPMSVPGRVREMDGNWIGGDSPTPFSPAKVRLKQLAYGFEHIASI
jgi:hypothetical protein